MNPKPEAPRHRIKPLAGLLVFCLATAHLSAVESRPQFQNNQTCGFFHDLPSNRGAQIGAGIHGKAESETILSTPQCSTGTPQSRPFPARAGKIMESAGQYAQGHDAGGVILVARKSANASAVKSRGHTNDATALDFDRLADAILRAEGVWTYGVKTVVVTNGAQARRVCLNTIRHAWQDLTGQGCFIDFLADRYCPPSVDPVGNRNWNRNVRSIYRQSL